MQGRKTVLPHEHVARHCKAADLFCDHTGQPTRLLESAFRPRSTDDDGLSAIWIEFFQGTRTHNLACVRSVTKLHVKSTDRIVLVNVGTFVAGLKTAVPAIAVEQDPINDLPPLKNAAHALIVPSDEFKNENIRDIAASLVLVPADVEEY